MYQNLLILIARFLMSGLFLYSGLGKIYGYYHVAEYMRNMGIPDNLLPFVIVFEIGTAISLVLGLFTRTIASLLCGFSIITAFIFHNDYSIMHNDIMFLKNLNMAGGFILLIILGGGRFSLDHFIRKKSH